MKQLSGVLYLAKGVAVIAARFTKWRQKFLLPLVLHSPLRHIVTWEETAPYGIKDEKVRAKLVNVLEKRDNKSGDDIGHFKMPASVILESKRLISAAKECLASVQRPTLVVHSVEDDMASIKNAHFVTRHIGSHKVETYFIDDSYHVVTMDRRKDDIAARVANFCLPHAA